MSLQITNLPGSTLDGAINDSVETLDVVSASSFPTGGDFWINVENEIMKVTGVSSNTFTVVRGESGGTAAASHSSGVVVTQVTTAQSITQLRADITRWGTYATMAALTDMKSGDVFWFDGSDTPYTKAIYNGSAWLFFYQNFLCAPFTDTTGYSWESGTNSLSAVGGTQRVTLVGETAVVRCFTKAAPSTPYTLTLLVKMVSMGTDTDESSFGIGLLASQSGSSTRIHWRFNPAGVSRIQANKWTDNNSFSASYFTSNTVVYQTHAWLKLEDNGTNRILSYSLDGVTWKTASTHANNDFLAPAGFVGFGGVNVSGADSYAWILSWAIT